MLDCKIDFWEEARWIRPKNDYGKVCPAFRRNFECVEKIKNARIFITAMGVYEAFLNGERIGNFIMAPGWTAYDKRHQYQCYDITKLIHTKNTLDVTVGKGWYRGALVEWRDSDIWGAHSALIAIIEIDYENGITEKIATDKEWKCAESKIRFSEIYDGESFDASFEPEEWQPSVYLHASKVNLIAQEGALVTEHERISPQRMFITPMGERVIDFGQNMTGYVMLQICAKSGCKIVYTHAEVLDGNGNFYTDNLRSAKQRIEYICREGQQSYKPHHTFMGFRYICLDEAPDFVNENNFTAIVVHSEMKRIGNFSCSDDKINKLYSNIIWSQKGNFLDIPTDCPQRDERLGWTGDAQMFIKTASYNYDVRIFFKKWLRDLVAVQRPDGGVPVVVPDAVAVDILKPGAAWGDAAVICPWQIYLAYGDKEVLKQQLQSMIAWVEYMHRSGQEEFLWRGDSQFGDWLGMDSEDGSYKGASDQDFIASAYFAYSTGILVKTLKAVQMNSSDYELLYDNVLKSFRKEYHEYRTQTECSLALVFGLTENRTKTAAQLAQLVIDNGNKLTTGFVGTPYILEALSENGYTELAYSLLLQEASPSWLFSVNMGATTIWEHWDGIRTDKTMWSNSMNSFNHYAYGAVGAWLYETVAGIRVDEKSPGFENVILCPKPDKRLTWVKCSVDTIYGEVTSEWSYEGDRIRYEFSVPNKAMLLIGKEKIMLDKGKHKFLR